MILQNAVAVIVEWTFGGALDIVECPWCTRIASVA
jgi:hypothetical protein